MNIEYASEKYLKPLVSLIEGENNQEIFKKYVSGLMLENENFSTLEINEKTEEKKLSQLYYFLNQSINWRKLLYAQAKAVLKDNNADKFSLIIDSSPIKQKYAENRITKEGFVDISNMERVPNNEVVGLYLTNGEIYNPLEFKFWSSSKITNKYEYKKKPKMLIEFLQYYGMNGIPVKKVIFDAFFNSKINLKWLMDNEYIFITRVENNRIVFINGERYVLKELGLNDGESIICELQGIKQNVKILRFWLQNEEYYIVTNDLENSDGNLKQDYLDRWECEVFHREAKQKLGLEKMLVRSWRKLNNRIGLICVVYGFLSAIKQHTMISIGKTKRKIQDFIYSTHNAADRLDCFIFS
ncbi:MAG: hypothetical protein A2287_03465 [Candidatus Melainabacteria bacterium RIFOXYA12_FULL_32_12]|nr:MAG: hypothetical protein A2287_03465 [Candidatus Melainabacteria bacterium RIFOXYA12_FULL_32_12]